MNHRKLDIVLCSGLEAETWVLSPNHSPSVWRAKPQGGAWACLEVARARIREHAGLSDTEGRGGCAWGPRIPDLKGPASKHSGVGTRCLGTRTLQPLTGCCPGSETGWGWPHSVHHGGCLAELNWEACH